METSPKYLVKLSKLRSRRLLDSPKMLEHNIGLIQVTIVQNRRKRISEILRTKDIINIQSVGEGVAS
jgi:hypothetical protein